jgi:hypothetical protein
MYGPVLTTVPEPCVNQLPDAANAWPGRARTANADMTAKNRKGVLLISLLFGDDGNGVE